MQREQIKDLLDRYANNLVNAEERALVETWYLKHKPTPSYPSNDQLLEDQQQSLENLLRDIRHQRQNHVWRYLAIAASVLVFLGIGTYVLLPRKKQQVNYTVQQPKKIDLPPGGNKATITLANGSVIVLNGTKTGTIATQGNIKIKKTKDGVIKYADTKASRSSTALVYNIASTPRGGQYQFVLSDGTKVWLNAASSIKFPVAFSGNERKVELTGEAYFEVTHDATKPFRVVSNGQVVEDLSTHFNINAYSDENVVKTTLIEGSISISAGMSSRIIKPGEQAQLKGGSFSIKNVDVDEAVAWKNGFFHFDDSPIQEVGRQLSRWYDVDIKFEGQLPTRLFSGEISRSVNASQILDILSFKKIHYRIEGKSIVILP